MNTLKRTVCLVLVLCLCWFGNASPAIAQDLPQFNSIHALTALSMHHYNTLAFLEWLFGRRPKRDDRPARTESAGRRGKCSEVSQSFIGFVPPVEASLESGNDLLLSPQVKSFEGLTTEEFPTLWFHVPALPEDVKTVELMIQDEQNTDVISEPVTVPITESSGVYSINWSASGVPLALNQSYHWYLSIICNSDRPSRNPSIDAWIQRVELTSAIAQQFESVTEEADRIKLYIEDGVWHDALNRLAQLRCQFPENEAFAEDWTTLLKSIGIQDNIAIAPILRCSL
jgi:Domain of Unknown Function (DUF928)